MKWALASLTGVLAFLALAPQNMFFLGWLAFLPLLWAHRDVCVKKAFLLGWLAGTIANLGNYYWVYELMVEHSAMPALAAVLGTVGLALQQGLREAIWLGLSRRFHTKSWPMLVTYPTIYVATEFFLPNHFSASFKQHSGILPLDSSIDGPSRSTRFKLGNDGFHRWSFRFTSKQGLLSPEYCSLRTTYSYPALWKLSNRSIRSPYGVSAKTAGRDG